jgi:solute carrier family 7 (L-type amino acid transporter), member 8
MGQGVLAMVYLVSTDIFKLINYLSFAGWLAIGVSAVALLYFRKKHPDWERPIKVSLFFPITYIILTVVLIALPFFKNPEESCKEHTILCTSHHDTTTVAYVLT